MAEFRNPYFSTKFTPVYTGKKIKLCKYCQKDKESKKDRLEYVNTIDEENHEIKDVKLDRFSPRKKVIKQFSIIVFKAKRNSR